MAAFPIIICPLFILLLPYCNMTFEIVRIFNKSILNQGGVSSVVVTRVLLIYATVETSPSTAFWGTPLECQNALDTVTPFRRAKYLRYRLPHSFSLRGRGSNIGF